MLRNAGSAATSGLCPSIWICKAGKLRQSLALFRTEWLINNEINNGLQHHSAKSPFFAVHSCVHILGIRHQVDPPLARSIWAGFRKNNIHFWSGKGRMRTAYELVTN
jgi:hypothetical protein